MTLVTMRMRAGFLLTFLMMWSVGPESAQAASRARIGDALAARWAVASPQEFVPVLVFMRDRVDMARDLPQLAYGRPALHARHTLAVDALQKRARTTQASVAATLDSMAAGGQARFVHRYWIDNMVGLVASPAALDRLARRPDVERIELLPDVYIPEPAPSATSAAAAGHEPGLDVIGAPAMWAQGYTGRGRLVCGIDTGVRGSHFALASRWRGLRVPAAEAWFDPRGTTSFPQDIGTNPLNHGSHTMGTMVGADDVRGDTVGVAPGAEWIAAYGIGSSALNTLDLIDCLQWAADPDGNPNTTDDVPDVVNGSWRFSSVGITYPCNDIMDGALSNLEAAGVVAIWAAGNEGPSATTIGYPANSVNAYSTNFSVGNIDGATEIIVSSSSRGPSPCAGDVIKPEVVAPGLNVRSCFRNNDSLYGTLSGTSMAAPHVAGAVALLRQVAPNATPAQIKQALFLSATDLGTAGEDNTYGRGLINLPAAADSLSLLMGGPDLRVALEQPTKPLDSLQAGDTVGLLFTLSNRGLGPATGCYLKLVTTDPEVSLTVDSIFMGIIPAEDTLTAPESLRFVIGQGSPEGEPLELTLQIGAVGFGAARPLVYYTRPAPLPGLFTHDNTLVTFTVTNYGQFGLGDQSYYPTGGAGFLFDPSTTNNLAEGALVIGASPSQVSDAARRAGGADRGYAVTDHDFAVAPGGALVTVPNLGGAFQTTQAVFDDSVAENPMGLRITQRSLIFPRGADEGYVMIIYTLENASAGALTGVRVGMLHDWDLPVFFSGGRDTTDFDGATGIGFMFDKTQVAAGPYRGVAVLSDPGAVAYRSINAQGTLYSSSSGEILLTDSDKWDFLAGGIGPSSVGVGTFGDAATFIGTGPFDFALPGDTVQVAFAFVGSEDGRAKLIQNAQAAAARYDSIAAGFGLCSVSLTGDVNLTGTVTAADLVAVVNYVFKAGPAPAPCPAAADVTCDGVVTGGDIVFLVNYIFKAGPAPCDVCGLIPAVWTCP